MRTPAPPSTRKRPSNGPCTRLPAGAAPAVGWGAGGAGGILRALGGVALCVSALSCGQGEVARQGEGGAPTSATGVAAGGTTSAVAPATAATGVAGGEGTSGGGPVPSPAVPGTGPGEAALTAVFAPPSVPAGRELAEKTLPPLEASALPPSTRQRPDPATQQIAKAPVYVSIGENVKYSSGMALHPPIRVVESYLKEYLRRLGHPIAPTPDQSAYTIEGEVEVEHVRSLVVLGRVAGWKYRGSTLLKVRRPTGEELEGIEVPELFEENARSEDSAALNLRRHLAKIIWDQLSVAGKTFSNVAVTDLMASLVLDPAEGESTTAEDVVARLADQGLGAVPYLLEALTDERSVRLPSSYPGLKPGDTQSLKVYHVADKALEEIFQKVSRMSLEVGSRPELRLVITRGWEQEWRRFCKSFAESPNAPGRKAGQ